jgi:CHRD domain
MGIPRRRAYMKKLVLAVTLAAAALTFVLASSALADNDNGGSFKASLNGYEEVVGGPGAASTGSVSTVATGRFEADFDDGVIEYELRYSGIEGGAVTQAHIHFAQPGVNGGIIVWFCETATNPSPSPTTPACPAPGVAVSGTIEPSDVLPNAGGIAQGIGNNEFDELVEAIRAGFTYANVHTTSFPGGEIRAQIKARGDGDDDD